MQGFEENEISKKSFGGTEITKRSIAKLVPEELANQFQIIASRLRDINKEKIRIYWQHDLPEDPEVSHLRDISSRDRFHKFVFSSNWQLNEFVNKLNFPQDDKVEVIETPVEPLPAHKKDFSNKIRLIYFSTPHRGLDILVPVFKAVCERRDDVHLDVFSSFKIYGWEDSDKQFEPLYDEIRNHPNMTYHGFQPQEVLKEHLIKAHILSYPCTWKETSCRVLMESMSAGLMCVHPNLAALPDTSGGITAMYQFQDNVNAHANMFFMHLMHAIDIVKEEGMQNYLSGYAKLYADNRFNLDKISTKWRYMMEALLRKYPDIDSRKASEQILTFRTS